MQAITAKALKHLGDRGEDFLLVNTLPAEMFAATKIPMAVNFPESDDDFVERVEQKAGDKGKTIVVYCANQQCESSSKAAKKLVEAGFTDVWDFEAGAEGWREMAKGKQGSTTRR